MRYVVAIVILAIIFTLGCQSESKPSGQVSANSTAQKPDEALNTPPSGITLTNDQIEAAFQEKMKELKPNANNASNGPIELKGVNFAPQVDEFMVNKGQKVFDAKCTSCHNLTEKPYKATGFMGITKKRRPEWIMNFTTGIPIDRLTSSGTEQQQLQQCFTRQQSQHLSIPEARDFLELMRHIDQ